MHNVNGMSVIMLEGYLFCLLCQHIFDVSSIYTFYTRLNTNDILFRGYLIYLLTISFSY